MERISRTYWSLLRILGIPRFVFGNNMKESWRPLASNLVFEVVWKSFVDDFCLVFEVSKILKNLSDFSCLVFEVVWKNLGDRFCFGFEIIWKNLEACVGFWSTLKKSWKSLCLVFEIIWKNLRNILCLAFLSSLRLLGDYFGLVLK